MKQCARKSMGLLLAAIMLLTMFPLATIAVDTSAEALASKLTALKSNYPTGTVKYEWDKGNYSCWGFALCAFRNLFGVGLGGTGTRAHSNVNELKIGDHIRYNTDYTDKTGKLKYSTHSIIITNISGTDVEYADCNGKGGINTVLWEQHMAKTDLQAKIDKPLNPEPPFARTDKTRNGGKGYIETFSENATTSLSGSTTPAPTGKSKLDLAFIVDTTGSMADNIAHVKENMHRYYEELKKTDMDFRVAVIDYRDFPERAASYDYPYRVHLGFTTNEASIQNGIDSLTLGYGGDTPETVFSGIINGSSDLAWREDAQHSIVLMGDAPALDPEPFTNYTFQMAKDFLQGKTVDVKDLSKYWAGASGLSSAPQDAAELSLAGGLNDAYVPDPIASAPAAEQAGEDIIFEGAGADPTTGSLYTGAITVYALNTFAYESSYPQYSPKSSFQALADASGGKYYKVDKTSDISDAISDVIKDSAAKAETIGKDYFKLWGKTTRWEKTPLNWILLIVGFGWIWMYFI